MANNLSVMRQAIGKELEARTKMTFSLLARSRTDQGRHQDALPARL